MTTPNSSLATHRPDLASFVEFDLEASFQGLIGAQIFPFFDVGRVAGNFARVTLESLTKSIETLRAPGAPYNRAKWEFKPESYNCEEHGQEEPLDDRQVNMYRDYFRAEVIATLRARNSILINHEIRVRDILSVDRSQNTPASAAWTDKANATPVDDVDSAVRACYDRGIMANAIVMSWKKFRDCIRTDQVVALIEASGSGDKAHPGSISKEKLAEVLNIDKVIVGQKQQNTAKADGVNTLSGVWADGTAFVTRVAETDDIQEPCCGRTMHWTEDGSEETGHVENYRDESIRSEVIRVRMDTDEKLLYGEAIERVTGV